MRVYVTNEANKCTISLKVLETEVGCVCSERTMERVLKCLVRWLREGRHCDVEEVVERSGGTVILRCLLR